MQNRQYDRRWNERRHVNVNNKWQQNSRFEYRRRREDEGKEKYVNRNKGMGMEANVINTNNEKDSGGYIKEKRIMRRKIVDEFLSKKNDNNSMGMNGWNEEMKSYSDKQKEVKKLIQEEGLQLCAILETHVKYKNIKKTCETVFGNWEYITNGEDNNKGVMVNENFMDKFQQAHGMFLPYMISDHSSIIVRIPNGVQKRKSSFRFSNFITDKKEFLPTEIVHRGRILSIRNEEGVRFENDDVSVLIVKHFEEFLGKSSQLHKMSCRNDIFINKLTSEEALKMVRPISDSEIKNAMFEIKDSKAPGPDGYTSRFYKSAWSIVGTEVSQAVREFFLTGKLLGEVNATLISLVPKIPTPNKVSNFRPIACCNVLYKFISKIMTNRIKDVLGKLVNENQIMVIKNSLDEFSSFSGLIPNMEKSTVFFKGLSNAEQQNILNIIPFSVGKLPIRQIQVPNISDENEDNAVWIARDGQEKKFKINNVWKDMVYSDINVNWFSMCPDSHNHLFFTCEFSNGIWKELLKMMNVKLSECWDHVIDEMKVLPSNKNIWSIVRRLVCGTAVYYIWQERNNRLFRNEKRDINTIINIAKEAVGMKLLGIKVKESGMLKKVEGK
ncbi:hypothetical protein Tco_0600246 [Tanacetum coccineum]|uniref:Reverse transcriptase domain-containing protein n=1 Tax=Tanacetum coccineum TaxID=301880 RepID=A0ABQ4WBC4_9ASTR